MAIRPEFPGITDAERGLALGGSSAPRLLMSTMIPLEVIKATDLREAAQTLGKIFLKLRKEDRGLGDWALPTARMGLTGVRVLARSLDAATKELFGSTVDSADRFRRYDNDFETVIPEVWQAARRSATVVLAGHREALGTLRRDVTASTFADWMHKAAQQIQTTKALYEKSAEDTYRSVMRLPPWYRPDPTRFDASWRSLVEATESFIQGEKRLGEAHESEAREKKYDYVSPVPLRAKYVELLQILRVQKRFADVVASYARSAAEGTKVAQQLITSAAQALDGFSASLDARPTQIWQYRVLIIRGVQDLKLSDVPGFQDFALAVAEVMGNKSPGALLGYASIGLMVVGLLSGVGASFMLLDLALGGAGVYFSYVREREHELAAKASVFLPDDQQLRSDYSYGETILGAAFLMVAAIGLLRGTKTAPAKLPARELPIPDRAFKFPPSTNQPRKLSEQPPVPPKKLDELPPRGIPEGTGGSSPVPGGPKAVAPEQKSLGANQKATESGKPSAKDPPSKVAGETSAVGEKGTKNKALPSEPGQQPVPSKSETPPRANSNAQKALPPKPLPPSSPDRLQNLGTWEKQDKVNVNEGGFKLAGSKKTALLDPAHFERGFNQNLAEDLATRLSNKPVRKDIQWLPGYETPSSGKTNRLKMQKTRAADVLKRRPEATMEVVENVRGQGSSVSEVHFFEATKQSDFKAFDEFLGHKQQQITGTVWTSKGVPRKGYSADTKVYYHILCPERPTGTTIDFLNKLMDDVPNLEINWFVVS